MTESPQTLKPNENTKQKTPEKIWALERKKCKSFSFFIRSGWHVLEPLTPLEWNWHYDVICEELEKQVHRIIARQPKEYDLIINVPPRSGKSTIVSKFFLPFVWSFYPGMRFITASYDRSLSLGHAVDSRTIILNQWYQRLWGDVFEFTGDQNVKSDYRNSEGGHRITTAVGAAGTGSGGNISILDDPLDRTKGVQSQTVREEAIRWYRQTWYGCLNNKSIDLRIIIMQRIHEEDPTGYLMKYFPGDYKLFCIPGELTDDVTPPELRKYYKNNLFFQTNYSVEVLENWKKVLQSDYPGQILQRPTAPEGNKFKRYWFKFWRPRGSNYPNIKMRIGTEDYICESRDLPEEFETIVNSWDMGLKPKTENDPSAGGVVAFTKVDTYLLDEDWGHYDPFEKEEHVISLKNKYFGTAMSIIEDETGGSETIIRLQKRITGVVGKRPIGSKWSRADGLASVARSGHLWLPHPAIFPQVWDIIDELCVFDRGKHDERVDYLSQAVNYYCTMNRIWNEYSGKTYNFKTVWNHIEKFTQPMIVQWVDKDMSTSIIISLWNSRTKVLWIPASFSLDTSLPEVVIKAIQNVLKMVFKNDQEAWSLDRYLYFGSPIMFSKAIGDVVDGYKNKGVAVNKIAFDLLGSIYRVSSLFKRNNILIHSRNIELKDKVLSWTMDDNEKNPEPVISGFGLCRALALTAAVVWESNMMPIEKKEPKPYARRKEAVKSTPTDWMKFV